VCTISAVGYSVGGECVGGRSSVVTGLVWIGKGGEDGKRVNEKG
jgi:hypothetical protein